VYSPDQFESLGCFPKSVHDDDTLSELHDQRCSLRDYIYSTSSVPCRSGLPFFRYALDRDSQHPEVECFNFCTSKGLDLFGIHGSECRCGATQSNPVWGDHWFPAGNFLSIDFSKILGSHGVPCHTDNWSIYRYIGWLEGDKELQSRNAEDTSYINSIIKVWADP